MTCSHDPRKTVGPTGMYHCPECGQTVIVGMYHCPECGEMVLAGFAHPDYDKLDNLTDEDIKIIEGDRK